MAPPRKLAKSTKAVTPRGKPRSTPRKVQTPIPDPDPEPAPKVGRKRPSEPTPRKRPLILGVWLPKGGVSKTTVALNLAGTLAAAGKRVLIVDADPQGSATDMVMDSMDPAAMKQIRASADADRNQWMDDLRYTEELLGATMQVPPPDPTGEPETEPDSESDSEDDESSWRFIGSDIMVSANVATPYDPLSALSRRSMMLQMPADIPKTFFEAVHNFKQAGPEKFALPTLLPVTLGCGGDNMFLLAGDRQVSQLATDLRSSDNNRVRILWAFHAVMSGLTERFGLDIILVDLGPSNDLTNVWLLNSCDAILPSFRPDYGSWSSFTQLLTEEMPYWRDWVNAQFMPNWGMRDKDDNLKNKQWHRSLYGITPGSIPDFHPKLLPGLGVQYTSYTVRAPPGTAAADREFRMSPESTSFLMSMAAIMARPGEAYVPDPVCKQVMRAGTTAYPQHAIPFLRHLSVFETSQEVGRPLTDLTHYQLYLEYEGRKTAVQIQQYSKDLAHVHERFWSLARYIDQVAKRLGLHKLRLPPQQPVMCNKPSREDKRLEAQHRADFVV